MEKVKDVTLTLTLTLITLDVHEHYLIKWTCWSWFFNSVTRNQSNKLWSGSVCACVWSLCLVSCPSQAVPRLKRSLVPGYLCYHVSVFLHSCSWLRFAYMLVEGNTKLSLLRCNVWSIGSSIPAFYCFVSFGTEGAFLQRLCFGLFMTLT